MRYGVETIIKTLLEQGLLSGEVIRPEMLPGGISSDIWLISDGNRRLVVKRARAKLDVKDDWYADTMRNRTEQEFMLYMRQILPGSVPELLYRHPKQDFFVMEYLDEAFENWKQQLLRGQADPQTVRQAAGMMSLYHRQSFLNKQVQKLFDSTDRFNSLRIAPYLLTTGDRHPKLKELFYAEAERLQRCRMALVHGDFSPKNIMVGPDRLVLLDHEAAWFGDPAFDLAFLLNHLYLKRLFHFDTLVDGVDELPNLFWNSYMKEPVREPEQWERLEIRVGRLLLMLMLARIDGKSPVEYLGENQKEFVRNFVYDLLTEQSYQPVAIHTEWSSALDRFAP